MKNLGTKHIAYIHNALLLLNFIIVLFNASIFLLSTKYLQAHGYASAFLENLSLMSLRRRKRLFLGRSCCFWYYWRACTSARKTVISSIG